MNNIITHNAIAMPYNKFMLACAEYTYRYLILGFSMIILDRLYTMATIATIDHWTMIENTCVGLYTYNLLVFMVEHDVNTEGDLSAPEFDEELSEDDYLHIQTSSCTIASRHVSVVIYASYAYKHHTPTLHNVSFARDGVCTRCHDEISETSDEILGHWQTEMCEECNRRVCMH